MSATSRSQSFLDAGGGVVGQGEQDGVADGACAGGAGFGEQRLDLVAGQVPQVRGRGVLLPDRQDLGELVEAVGLLDGGVAAKRLDHREALVAGGRRAARVRLCSQSRNRRMWGRSMSARRSFSGRMRSAVLQAVQHVQMDSSNSFENFVRVLKSDQKRVAELESGIADVLRRLSTLQSRSLARCRGTSSSAVVKWTSYCGPPTSCGNWGRRRRRLIPGRHYRDGPRIRRFGGRVSGHRRVEPSWPVTCSSFTAT